MEAEVVVPDRRAQQKGLLTIDRELEVRQETRVAVEETVRSAGRRTDVAVAVEDGKGIVVLERQSRPGRGSGRRDVERRLACCGRLVLERLPGGYQKHPLFA